jgi:hypothetical protein
MLKYFFAGLVNNWFNSVGLSVLKDLILLNSSKSFFKKIIFKVYFYRSYYKCFINPGRPVLKSLLFFCMNITILINYRINLSKTIRSILPSSHNILQLTVFNNINKITHHETTLTLPEHFRKRKAPSFK